MREEDFTAPQKSALVVLSGGQDSTTCLYWALETYERVEAVTFDYNQRHRAELDAAVKVVEMAAEVHDKPVPHKVVTLGPIFEGASPLTAQSEELETYSDISEMDAVIQDRVELTFVPGRNLIFLSLASSYAVARGIDCVVTGICQADAANYPDCRRMFADALEDAVGLATLKRVPIVTPLIDLAKPESIKLAQTLRGCMNALAYTHTAYSGEYPPSTQDHATVLRAWGFEQAGVADPLLVRAWQEGVLDELPATSNYDELRRLQPVRVKTGGLR